MAGGTLNLKTAQSGSGSSAEAIRACVGEREQLPVQRSRQGEESAEVSGPCQNSVQRTETLA